MKILVVRYRFIGDTLLTIPFLRNLRNAYPDAQIDMLVAPISGDVLADCPYIDNLIYFDTTKRNRYENNKQEKRDFWYYVKLLKKEKYDKAYVLKRSLSSAFLCFMAGIKERIGFNTEGRGILLTKRIPYQRKHEIECFLDVLKADGIEPKDFYLENFINEEADKKISELLKEVPDKPKVVIHATSGNIRKQWPLSYFAQVVEYLSNEKDMQVFYSGAPSDTSTYEKIHSLIKTPLKNEPLNFCGKLNLKESTALIRKMDLMVGCDSGNLHIAASVNVPVIGIYGPMDFKRWQAYGEIHTPIFSDMPCAPCGLKKKCKGEDKACLKNIKPETIIKEIDKKLDLLKYNN